MQLEAIERELRALTSRARDVHAKNIAKGWWEFGDEPFAVNLMHIKKINLIFTEIAEMVEGHRKQIQDDKLPHYRMDVVEAADVVIRSQDMLGRILAMGEKAGDYEHDDILNMIDASITGYIQIGGTVSSIKAVEHNSDSIECGLHTTMFVFAAKAHEGLIEAKVFGIVVSLVSLIGAAIEYVDQICGWQTTLSSVIDEKAAYNAVRADHMPDARSAAGGKRY